MAREAYERLKGEFLHAVVEVGPLDGVYLAMHGAMFVEGMEDAEGDWISTVRAAVGPRCKIAVSYDLHGNVTQGIVDAIDIFSTYRTAPHVDVEATMRRSPSACWQALAKDLSPSSHGVPCPSFSGAT